MLTGSPLLADPTSVWSAATLFVGIGGLICGIILMASLTTDWKRLPDHLRLWGRALRRQSGWTMLAIGSMAVLLFY